MYYPSFLQDIVQTVLLTSTYSVCSSQSHAVIQGAECKRLLSAIE